MSVSNPSIAIEGAVRVASNASYTYAVGRIRDRWIGFAVGDGMIFAFTGVSDGYRLGLADRDEAIRRVSAIARESEPSMRSPLTWHVAEDLRADPGAYRCATCGAVFCDADHAEDLGSREP